MNENIERQLENLLSTAKAPDCKKPCSSLCRETYLFSFSFKSWIWDCEWTFYVAFLSRSSWSFRSPWSMDTMVPLIPLVSLIIYWCNGYHGSRFHGDQRVKWTFHHQGYANLINGWSRGWRVILRSARASLLALKSCHEQNYQKSFFSTPLKALSLQSLLCTI